MVIVKFQSMGDRFLVIISGGRVSYDLYAAYTKASYYDNLRRGRVMRYMHAQDFLKLLKARDIPVTVGEDLEVPGYRQLPIFQDPALAVKAEIQAFERECQEKRRRARVAVFRAHVQGLWMATSPKIRPASCEAEEEAIAGLQKLSDIDARGQGGAGWALSTRDPGESLLACYDICQQLTDDQWLAARNIAYFHRRQLT